MSDKTLFQRIADGEIPADIVYQDEHCVCFRDINPQAPTHVLLVPRKPIPRLSEATPEDHAVLGHLMVMARVVAEQIGVAGSGFRIIVNNGPDGGEEIPHLHLHLLGGRPLGPMLSR
jgi:histidine triad (HIT) family protein